MLTGRHVMIDLETLGTSTSAMVLQIGLCEFFPQEGTVGRHYSAYIDMGSSLRAGRAVDPDTFLWWLGQDREAQQRLINGMRTAQSLASVLQDVTQWMLVSNGRQGLGRREAKPDGVWSHGLTFDVPILDEAFSALGLSKPWDFWGCLDTRTLFALAGVRLGDQKKLVQWPEDAPPPVHHDAQSDAIGQALVVMRVLGMIERRVVT